MFFLSIRAGNVILKLFLGIFKVKQKGEALFLM